MPFVPNKSWKRAHYVAYISLILTSTISIISLFPQSIFCVIPNQLTTFNNETQNRLLPFTILFLLFVTQLVVHKLDKKDEVGIVGRYQRLLNSDPTETEHFHIEDRGAIRAFVTKQSIFAALSMFLIGQISSGLQTDFLVFNAKNFSFWLKIFSAGGFLAVLLIVLVSIQIYSSYLRIDWCASERKILLRKGRKLDELSFYTLTISILIGLCAYQPLASLIAIPLFGWLLFYYYFFSES